MPAYGNLHSLGSLGRAIGVACDDGTFSFHAWIEPGAEFPDVIFKNPLYRQPHDPGHATQLNPGAACNQRLKAFLLSGVDQALEQEAAEVTSAQRKREREYNARVARDRLEHAAPALLAALKQWARFARSNEYSVDPAHPSYVSFLADTLAAIAAAEVSVAVAEAVAA